MRHVNPPDLVVPEVEDEDRFFPDPVLLRTPPYRRTAEGRAEIRLEDKGWTEVHALYVDIIEALERGLSFAEMVDQLPTYPNDRIHKRHVAGKLARRYLWHLHKYDVVRLELEAPPERFQGRYRHLKELGRGGLGVAHLCADEAQDDLRVVVKHPWGVKNTIRAGQKALAREIRAMELLDHDGIPRLHDTFQVRGLLHLVREYIDGPTLKRLQRKGTTDPRHLSKGIARLLEAMHLRGALCLDICPDNFMLQQGGQVLLSDLGTVTFMDGDRVRFRSARGSPGYMAPEVQFGRPRGDRWAGVRSEVFSFGRLHYYLLLGERPSRSWDEQALEADLRTQPLDERDRSLVTACCRDDPEERPPSMRRVLEEFF